jgi:hypothetical protein
VHDGECSLSNGPPVARLLQQGPVRGIFAHTPRGQPPAAERRELRFANGQRRSGSLRRIAWRFGQIRRHDGRRRPTGGAGLPDSTSR